MWNFKSECLKQNSPFMINKLTDFTNKSFKRYTNPNDLLFREKNILFGYNGRGKTSFAVGLKGEFLKDNSKKENNIRYFNKEEYITKTLLLKDSEDKLNGVIANFGEKDVEIEGRIKELEKDIVPETYLQSIQSEIGRIRRETRREIDTIHDRRKGKAHIQKKSSTETIERVIELYNNDYADAHKIENDDATLLGICGDDTIENRINQINSLSPLALTRITISTIDEIKVIFTERFGDDLVIPEYEIVQWIDAGMKVHREGDKCKFCGGKFDYLEIQSKIKQYKENKKHKAIEKMKSFNDQLQKIKCEIQAIAKVSKTYLSIMGNLIEEDFQKIIGIENALDIVVAPLQNKIDNIENVVNFDFEKLQSIFESIDTSVSNIHSKKDEQLKELYSKLNNLKILVKGAIGLEIKNSKTISDKLKEARNKEADRKAKHDGNKTKMLEIQDLKQQKSPTKDFAIFISQIFQDINISLTVSLDNDNHNYIIKSLYEDVPLSIKDISEGEKNLLALLFFYYELFFDNQQREIKTEVELIIVDDPISSMDDSNKFYIMGLMKNLLNLSNIQVFILTHSWDDFSNLSYGRKKNINFATFEIRKNNGCSELVRLNNYEKPYKYLFKEVFEFSNKLDNQIGSKCEVYHYPNVIRRVFEEWYSFKMGSTLNLTSSQQDHLIELFKISGSEKQKLGMLLNVCNTLSHNVNTTRNPQEIHQSAKFLMNLIKKHDKMHFDSMKQ